MQVIIPMAGKGTRLRPHTHAVPKPLLKVAGKEMLAHILDEIVPLKVSDVFFVVGHMREKLEDFVKQKYPELNGHILLQEKLLGTADAIHTAAPYVKGDVLIIFADALFDTDLSIARNLDPQYDGIVWVKEVKDPEKYGVIITDNAGIMKEIVEKPEKPASNLINIGIQYIKNSKMLFEATAEILAGKPAPNGEYYLTDALRLMIDKGVKLKTVPVNAWFDCGHPEALLESNRWLLERGMVKKPKVDKPNGTIIHDPVNVADGVLLENAEIGPNVTIENGTSIKNSKISDTIIGRETVIENSNLANSLIGSEAVIKRFTGKANVPDHSTLEGKL